MSRFPKGGVLLYAELHDQGKELLLEKDPETPALVPILGLLQVTSEKNEVKETYDDRANNEIPRTDGNEEKNRVKEAQASATPGRLVVYGDSNCIDDSHLQKCTYY